MRETQEEIGGLIETKNFAVGDTGRGKGSICCKEKKIFGDRVCPFGDLRCTQGCGVNQEFSLLGMPLPIV